MRGCPSQQGSWSQSPCWSRCLQSSESSAALPIAFLLWQDLWDLALLWSTRGRAGWEILTKAAGAAQGDTGPCFHTSSDTLAFSRLLEMLLTALHLPA